MHTTIANGPEQGPTPQAYGELQQAYDFFNRRLFDGRLPPCLITLQRHKRAYGYFCAKQFASHDGNQTDEIAMNPRHLVNRSDARALSTLVHEMVHLWQEHFGSPSRRCYHNREWAAKMCSIGLIPSNTGEPGGRQTGQGISHYIETGGRFDQACTELLAGGFRITWGDRIGNSRISSKGGDPDGQRDTGKAGIREKYTCPSCGLNAWARPEVSLVCGQCEKRMIPSKVGNSISTPSIRP